MQPANQAQPETIDLLEQLPLNKAANRQYRKDQVIYAPDSTEDLRIHLVQEGRIVTKSLSSNGEAVGLEMLEAEDMFGLEAIIGPYTTLARCAEPSITLSWTVADVRELMELKPKLAIGILQTSLSHLVYFQHRVEEFAIMKIQERLATFLIQKAARKKATAEEPEADGGVTLPPITHEVMSQFIGTSREIVTHYLNTFRQAGYISYSRKEIRVFNPQGFSEWVRVNSSLFDAGFE